MLASSSRGGLLAGLSLATLLAAAGGPRQAGAQSVSRLMPTATLTTGPTADSLVAGARYRITLPKLPDRIGPQFREERWLTGELVAVRGDSLVLRPHPLTTGVAVPFVAIDRLERSRGVSRAGSAIEGAIGGAILGALAGFTLYDHGLDGPNFATRGRSVGTVAAYAGSIGLLTGILFPTERWRRVDAPGR
jgi:hypothetical protein